MIHAFRHGERADELIAAAVLLARKLLNTLDYSSLTNGRDRLRSEAL